MRAGANICAAAVGFQYRSIDGPLESLIFFPLLTRLRVPGRNIGTNRNRNTARAEPMACCWPLTNEVIVLEGNEWILWVGSTRNWNLTNG